MWIDDASPAARPDLEGLLEAACEAKSGAACEFLARQFEVGIHVGEDDARAIALYAHSCGDLQSRKGCEEAGAFYSGIHRHPPVPQDFTKAAHFYALGCALKSGKACAQLSLLYASGSGVARKDPIEAKRLMQRARSLGFVPP